MTSIASDNIMTNTSFLTTLVTLAENAHPFNQEPIGVYSPLELLPESEELVSVSAEKAVPW